MTDASASPTLYSLWSDTPVIRRFLPKGSRSKKAGKKLPFSTFPLELILNVLKFSSPVDPLSLSKVNSALHRMIIDPTFWATWSTADPTGARQREWASS
jgi:hypothetical protein